MVLSNLCKLRQQTFVSDQARYQVGAARQKNSLRTSAAPSGTPELVLCDACAF